MAFGEETISFVAVVKKHLPLLKGKKGKVLTDAIDSLPIEEKRKLAKALGYSEGSFLNSITIKKALAPVNPLTVSQELLYNRAGYDADKGTFLKSYTSSENVAAKGLSGAGSDLYKTATGVGESALDAMGLNKTVFSKVGGTGIISAEIGKVASILGDLGGDKIQDLLSKVGLDKILGPLIGQLGIAGEAVQKLINHMAGMTSEYEELRKQVLITTNANNEYYISLHNLSTETTKALGITRKALIEEYTKLSDDLSLQITKDAEKQIKRLTVQSQILQRLGVEGTKDLFQELNTQFGLSESGIQRTTRRLTKYSEETGQSYKRVFNDYKTFLKNFSTELNSETLQKGFTTFQVLARKTGIEMTALQDRVMQFDDLSTGFDLGSKMNIVLTSLGGSFDSMYMTQLEDQDERMKYMVDQIYAVKDNIDKLRPMAQRSYVKALSEATGFNAEEIRKILSGTKASYEEIFDKKKSGLGMKESTQEELYSKLMDIPKNIEEMTKDNIPSAVVLGLQSISKVITDADDRLFTKLFSEFDNKFVSGIERLSKELFQKSIEITKSKSYQDSDDKNSMWENIQRTLKVIQEYQPSGTRPTDTKKLEDALGTKRISDSMESTGKAIAGLAENVKALQTTPLRVESSDLNKGLSDLATAMKNLTDMIQRNPQAVAKTDTIHGALTRA